MSNAHTQQSLPPELEQLWDLALDLRLTGSQSTECIWESLDPEAWERTRNPAMILQHAQQDRLEELAANEQLLEQLTERIRRRQQYLNSPGWFDLNHGASALKGVAYFSMEFGLSEALPIYSGGLGILAGDHMKSASDLNVPVHGIGLLYQQGYFRQVLANDGWQLEAFPYNDPGTLPVTPLLDSNGRWPRLQLELPGRMLHLRAWQAQVGRLKIYLLDSNHPLNSPWDRGITANLYAAGREKRLLQELVLGVGGWRLIEELKLDIQVCHLNEGHAAFAVLARAGSFAKEHGVSFDVALRATRAGNVFTTHTPVEAAFDRFDPELIAKYAQPYLDAAGVPVEQVLAMGRRNPHDTSEPLNMAFLALHNACHVNGVARLHGRVSRQLFGPLFPGLPLEEVPVGYVTNGIHVPTWDSVPANELWREAYRGAGPWVDVLDEALPALDQISDARLWQFRAEARAMLIDYLRRRLEHQLSERSTPAAQVQGAAHILDPNCLTFGFARRFTSYKRPTLLLHDPERFARFLNNPQRPAQIVIAGKAHPNDDEGKAMVQEFARYAQRADVAGRVVFLEDYDIALAQQFATGVDVWLNNPLRPNEACGTSGMKMLVNGGLHCSILDGWWDEAYRDDLGFKIGDEREHHGEFDADDARSLYEVLENQIAPEFYDRSANDIPHAWVQRIRTSMKELTGAFSSNRMVTQYTESSYLPAAEAFIRRSAGGAKLARELEQWQSRIEEAFGHLRFGNLNVEQADDAWHFNVQVYLGELCPDCVCVQLYSETTEGQPTPLAMQCEGPIHGAVNGFHYCASVPADRPAHHYTPRVVPAHAEAAIPLEAPFVHWRS